MFRVGLSIGLGLASMLVGCASEPPLTTTGSQPALVTRTKTVVIEKRIVVEKTRTCTTTLKAADACAVRKTCDQIATCAEAYYLLTACKGNNLLDGGSGYPSNGIPCEAKCGSTAISMTEKIRASPFAPPTSSETVCTPPAPTDPT